MSYVSMVREINKQAWQMLNSSSAICGGTNKNRVMPKGNLGLRIEGKVVEYQIQHHLGRYKQNWELLNKYLTSEERRMFKLSSLSFSLRLPKKTNAEKTSSFIYWLIDWFPWPSIKLCGVLLVRKQSNPALRFSSLPFLCHQLAEQPWVRLLTPCDSVV